MATFEVRAINVENRMKDGDDVDSWIIEPDDMQPDYTAKAIARLMSKVKEYDYVEVYEDGQRTKVYVRGHCVLSN